MKKPLRSLDGERHHATLSLLGAMVCAVFSLWVSAARAEPIISPPTTIDTPVYRADYGTQGDSEIVWTGSHYFVVWNDGGSFIRGARVDSNGSVVDKNGIPIVSAAGVDDPSVAYAGGVLLVVWTDDGDVHGVLLNPDGTALGAPFVVSGAADVQGSPAVATDGSAFFVVWEDDRAGPPDIYGARVTASGQVLDPAGIQLTSNAAYDVYPQLAFGNGEYLVTWSELQPEGMFLPGDVRALRLDAAGTPLQPVATAVTTTTTTSERAAPSLWTGNAWLVLWSGGGVVEGAFYDGVMAPQLGPFTIAADGRYPRAASVGGELLVGYTELLGTAKNAVAKRIDGGGNVLDPNPIVLAASHDEYLSSIASNSSGYLASWSDNRFNGMPALSGLDVFAARLGTQGAVTDPGGFHVSSVTNSQWSPEVACGPAVCLVVWQDDRHGESDSAIWAHRLGVDGMPIGSAIMVASYPPQAWRAAVTFDGAGFVVTWRQSGDILVRTVSTAGSLGPIVTVAGNGYNDAPAIASSTNGDTLIAWSKQGAVSQRTIHAQRLGPGAVTVGGPIFVHTGTFANQVDMAFSPPHFTLVWEEDGTAEEIVNAARIDTSGMLLDADPIRINQPGGYAGSPSIDCHSGGCLVYFDGLGRRIATNGTLPEAAPFVIGPGSAYKSYDVAWNETHFLVTDPLSGGLQATRIRDDGSIVDTFSVASYEAEKVAVAGLSNGWLVVDQSLHTDPALMTQRLRARTVVGGEALGVACAADADCASGWCVDGVCCDGPCGASAADCQACSTAEGASSDGICTPTDGNPCDDQLVCTENDACIMGACMGSPSPDGAPCPAGLCDGGTCVEPSTSGVGGAGGDDPQTSSGGTGGTGGTGGGGGGTGGAAGDGQDGGCTCSTAPRSTRRSWFYALLLPLLLVVRRGRTRSGGPNRRRGPLA